MIGLSKTQNDIHQKAILLVSASHELDWKIIEILAKAEGANVPRAFQLGSLFEYAVKILGLDEAKAYSLITLSRKTREIPALATALAENRVSASKASRVASVMNKENCTELISFAASHSKREIEFEMARRNPMAKRPEKVRPLSEGNVEITITISSKSYQNLVRIQSLKARQNPKTSLSDSVESAAEWYLHHRDPVRKAERSEQRKNSGQRSFKRESLQKSQPVPSTVPVTVASPVTTAVPDPKPTPIPIPVVPAPEPEAARVSDTQLCPGRVRKRKLSKRITLTAAQKHAAMFVSKGKCTFRGSDGKPCNSDRYVDLHHIIEVSRGGSNDPANLTAYCYFHHRLVHRKETRLPSFEDWINNVEATHT